MLSKVCIPAVVIAGTVAAAAHTAYGDQGVRGYEGEAKVLLQMVAQRYQSLKTYRDTFNMTVAFEASGPFPVDAEQAAETKNGAPKPTSRPISSLTKRQGAVIIERPAKFLMDGANYRVFCDGERIAAVAKATGTAQAGPLRLTGNDRPDLKAVPQALREALNTVPHMALLLADDVAREMCREAEEVSVEKPETIAGAKCHALRVRYRVLECTYYIDQETHLVRRIVTDLKQRANRLLQQDNATCTKAELVLTVLHPQLDAVYGPETFELSPESAKPSEIVVKILTEAPRIKPLKRPTALPAKAPTTGPAAGK